LEVFHGTPITISDNLRVITNGKKDSLHFDISDKFARFIVYVDSLECSSCRAGRMYEYNGVIDFRDSVGMQFMPIFIFSPPERVVEELLYQVRVSYFDYPILLDDSGLFPIINPHIPTDPRFHTFLLDKNGKVVLVGDPVHNPGLWELYKKTITELIENGGTLAQCC
jgi:hypothetical protein